MLDSICLYNSLRAAVTALERGFTEQFVAATINRDFFRQNAYSRVYGFGYFSFPLIKNNFIVSMFKTPILDT